MGRHCQALALVNIYGEPAVDVRVGGTFQLCRFLQALHTGSFSSLAKVQS